MTPTSVLVLSCEHPPVPEVESPALAQGLQARGVRATVVPWNRTADFPEDRDLVVIRGTWDYTLRVDDFLAVLESQPVPVANPTDIVRWNAHKGYLAEIVAAGIPVVPTALVRAAADRPGTSAFDESFGEKIVIKPAVAAGSAGVGLFTATDPAAGAHLALLLERGDVLIQPFVPEIAQGERSLIRLGDTWSHALRKVPAAGDFRVQQQFGGDYRPHVPSAREIEIAEAALALVPGGPGRLSYARVDLIGPEDSPMVTELELIEPDLYLRHFPHALDLLVDALLTTAG